MRRCDLCLVLFMSLIWGCATAPSGPVRTYDAFYHAVSMEDWDRAVGFLSPSARKVFTKVGGRLQSIVGADEGDALDFFLQGVRARLHTPLVNVEEIEKGGNTAKLKVVAGDCGKDEPTKKCFESEVSMVLVLGRWYVDPKLPPMGVEGVTTGG